MKKLYFKIRELAYGHASDYLIALAATLALVISLLDFLGIKLSTTSMYQSITLTLLALLTMQTVFNGLRSSNNVPISKRGAPDLNSRLHELTQALTDAGSVISAMETEIQSRQELATQLERQKAIAEQAIKLSREQVDAVSALLSEQVSKQNKLSARRELIKDIALFATGIFVTIILRKLGVG